MNNILKSIFLLVALIVQACDRPECTNQNSIFDEHSPDSQ